MSAKAVHNAILISAQNSSTLSNEFGSNIKKGSPDELDLTSVGKTLRIIFTASSDGESGLSYNKVRAIYGFLIIVAFYEPNEETAEDRKADYDKMIRDWIDNDLSFGGVVFETTQVGKMQYAESPDSKGIYYGVIPVVCEKYEQTGNR